MKKLLYLLLINSVVVINSHASIENNSIIKKDIEDIKYLSQKITNNYLYLYQDPRKIDIYKEINRSITKLEDNFRDVAKKSLNRDTKDILDFLSYSKDQIKELIQKKITKESISQMIDISNSLLEGADSISDNNTYSLRFHLAKISKLYMLKNLGFDLDTDELKKEIDLIDKSLIHDKAWISSKELLKKRDCFTPNIFAILIDDLQNRITKR